MNTSKQLSSVALFPLCDARGILMEALRDTTDIPATRGDALVFAWRLELPEGMNVGHAANAVLLCALSVPRSSWNRRQLLIIRELMVLAGREEPLPAENATSIVSSATVDSVRNRETPKVSRQAIDSPGDQKTGKVRSSVAKQDKEWWKLVGKGHTSLTGSQRKTRSGRVSREP